MTNPIPISGSEFNDFLFAPIGEDRNGMPVSVLSGLARSDVDPWQEAAKLAQLPGEAATRELAALIGTLLDVAAPSSDPGTIAARLFSTTMQLTNTPYVRAWLDRYPRFGFHFTPTSCFWLNAVDPSRMTCSRCLSAHPFDRNARRGVRLTGS